VSGTVRFRGTTTDHHRPPQTTADHHRLSQTIADHHRPPQTTTDHHRPLYSLFINVLLLTLSFSSYPGVAGQLSAPPPGNLGQ